ncbi:hypothetical protein BU14_0130s0010 [Porphyra umbilicalis]|uniref:Uncharacterized protein n=1 Tax=Porphyra umbilicalis TaxID=2786 RepID=A0A1X6PAV3_PORUM|nr:hypothetical protein BU14_0130s0010 [Porphyra umbilicalis]|eukprot:OSX77855.1 hypothetical protein BU14_0130s0010 [Porphyra umbilicalis]
MLTRRSVSEPVRAGGCPEAYQGRAPSVAVRFCLSLTDFSTSADTPLFTELLSSHPPTTTSHIYPSSTEGAPTAVASRARKRAAAGVASPPEPSAKKRTFGERKTLLAAARNHWSEYRGRRTRDKTRRTWTELSYAFVSLVPAAEKAAAAARDPNAQDKKLKNMRSSYSTAAKGSRRTGASKADKEDAIIKFGGAARFEIAKVVFEDCPVSHEHTVLEPVDFLRGADDDTAGHGGGAVFAAGDVSDGGVVPPADSTCTVRSGSRDKEFGKCDGGEAIDNDYSDGKSDGMPPSGARLAASVTASPRKNQTAVEIDNNVQSKKAKTVKKDLAVNVLRNYLQVK